MFIVSLFPPKFNTSILLLGPQHLLRMLAKCYLVKNFSLLLLCVCMMYVCGHVCALLCGGQRTTLETWFSFHLHVNSRD